MKKVILIIGILAILFVVGYVVLQEMAIDPDDVIISDVDISTVEDGVYTGEYITNLVTAKVEVQVENGEIVYINLLEHQNGLGGAAEDILDDVQQAQSLNVDTISGATISSKIILKAVENALLGN